MKAFDFREYIRTIVVCSVGSCFLYTSGYFSSEGTDSGNGPQTQKLLCGSVPRMHWAIFFSPHFKGYDNPKACLPRRVGWPKWRVPIGTQPWVRDRILRVETDIRCSSG